MTREEAIAELNVLHERLSNPKDCGDGCYSWEDGRYVEAFDMAIEALQAKPKTGKWEEKYIEDAPPFLKHRFYCSNCGEWITYGTADFCCHCGADMRG